MELATVEPTDRLVRLVPLTCYGTDLLESLFGVYEF